MTRTAYNASLGAALCACAAFVTFPGCIGSRSGSKTQEGLLDVEGFETYSQAFLPEETRAMGALVRLPSAALHGSEIGQVIYCCLSPSGGRLTPVSAASSADDCGSNTTSVRGTTLWYDRSADEGFIELPVFDLDRRRQLWREWKEHSEDTTPVVSVRLQIQDHGEIVSAQVERVSFRPGRPIFVH